MNALKQLAAEKAKAICGAVLAAVVGYLGTALATSTAITLHGLEVAAVGALAVAVGVHQTPNRKHRAKKETA